MAKEPDFLYEKAPLIEVIAEVRWKLTPLASMPGSAFDPHYGVFADEFSATAKAKDFSFVEPLVPPGMPPEMLPNAPHLRFRKGAGTWPLYQIGPGLFTANAIRGYKGWQEFRRILSEGLVCLGASYPLPDKYLQLRMVELRYVNGFTSVHGFTTFEDFISDHLGCSLAGPRDVVKKYAADPASVAGTSEVRFRIKEPPGLAIIKLGLGGVKATIGRSDEGPAVIVELILRDDRESSMDRARLTQWFDDAHHAIRDWFQTMTSKTLKERMGPKQQIEG